MTAHPDPPVGVVLGAVLAGGASRRMGVDKALLEIDGVPMAGRAAAALRAAGASRVVLVGGDPAWATRLGLEAVADRWPGEGPLGGLATALLDGPGTVEGGGPGAGAVRAVVVVACDQPWLEPGPLVALVAALDGAPGDGSVDRSKLDGIVGAVAVTPDGRRQLLPSAWRPAAGPAVGALVADGQRRLDAALAVGPVREIWVDDASLADVDTPADLA